MTETVQQLLNFFDALLSAEKHQATIEILRRYTSMSGDIPEETLSALADELFLALDNEAAGQPTR
jgi:hypothetical protein